MNIQFILIIQHFAQYKKYYAIDWPASPLSTSSVSHCLISGPRHRRLPFTFRNRYNCVYAIRRRSWRSCQPVSWPINELTGLETVPERERVQKRPLRFIRKWRVNITLISHYNVRANVNTFVREFRIWIEFLSLSN